MFTIFHRSFSFKKFLYLLGILVLFTLHGAFAMQMALEALSSIISGEYPVWPFADVCPDPSLISNPLVEAILELIFGAFFGILIFIFGIVAMKMVDDAEF